MARHYLLNLKERTLLTIGTHLPKTVIRQEDVQTWIDQLTARGEITNRGDDYIVFRVETKKE